MSDLGNKEVLARNLKRLMSENNIDRNKMCDDLKLKYSTVSEWLFAFIKYTFLEKERAKTASDRPRKKAKAVCYCRKKFFFWLKYVV